MIVRKIWKNIENTATNNPNRAINKAYWFGFSMAALGAELGMYFYDLKKRGERVLFKERIEKGELKFYDVEKCSDTSIKLHQIKIVRVSFDVDDIAFIDHSGRRKHTSMFNLFYDYIMDSPKDSPSIIIPDWIRQDLNLPLGKYIWNNDLDLYVFENSLNKEKED